jgi:hypothetical protein
MASALLRNEIVYKAPTRVGLLAEVAEALHAADINLYAIGAYDKEGMGEFLMLTSDNGKAFETLKTLGGEVDLVPVVVAEVPNTPGELAHIARLIANAGVNITQIHATTTDAPTAAIVMRTDREAEVVELLRNE